MSKPAHHPYKLVIDDALVDYWTRNMKTPAEIRVNPDDMDDLVLHTIQPQRRWLLRKQKKRVQSPAPRAGQWINAPAGGIAVPIVYDPSVSRGTVTLMTAYLIK